ncbi:MAG: hypothetical protein QMD82_05880 [bacterium]|nr:hypothetical protein [bacterium]
MSEDERLLSRIIWLSVGGKLRESYEICKEHGFKFGWCLNLKRFFGETDRIHFMRTDILLKALYSGITTEKERKELRHVIKYLGDIPLNAILIEKLKSKI